MYLGLLSKSVAERRKEMLIVLPSKPTFAGACVIALHGNSWGVEYMAEKSGLYELAEKTGATFYVPQGLGRVMNYDTPGEWLKRPIGLPQNFSNWQWKDEKYRWFGGNQDVELLLEIYRSIPLGRHIWLYGFSAGAVMVNYLLSSPLARGIRLRTTGAVYYSSALQFEPAAELNRMTRVWSVLNDDDKLKLHHEEQDEKYRKLGVRLEVQRYEGGGHSIHPEFIKQFGRMLGLEGGGG